MSVYVYDPQKGTVDYKDQTVLFYCGPELNDIAILLLDFYFQKSNLQETFTRLVNEITKNRIDQATENNESELADEVKRQISRIIDGGHHGKVTIQDANRLIKLMGGDIVFGIENSEMVNYYITLLLIQKRLS